MNQCRKPQFIRCSLPCLENLSLPNKRTLSFHTKSPLRKKLRYFILINFPLAILLVVNLD